MFVSEVENIVGLSKKSIRYYEKMGLLSPKRNNNNDYRIYDEEDIKKLKVIKFLRELDVPIREIQLLDKKEITLKECMINRINKINDLEININKVKNMCEEIKNSNDTYEDIDINKYFKEIRVLNKKEGFTMNNENISKNKKIGGAIISSLLFSLMFLFLIGVFTYLEFTEEANLPIIIYLVLMLILLLPVLAILINLINRIKEILGGEEDEASKY